MKKIKEKQRKKFIYLLILVLCIVSVIIYNYYRSEKSNTSDEKELSISLDNGLEIKSISKYTGAYVEDGSDEAVEDVIMISVYNSSNKPLQYAQISLTNENESALFQVSTLNPGESVRVLEAERKSCGNLPDFTEATSENVVFFDESLELYSDILSVQALDGGFNITNISDNDIEGEIVLYYKNCDDKGLFGGITYRGRIEDGLSSGEVRQVMTEHFTKDSTKVMFISIIGEIKQ